MAKNYNIYTDGGCHGNPGPGGWAYVIEFDGEHTENSGSDGATTNNRMELSAVIEALTWVQHRGDYREIHVTTDSQYVKNGITTWIHTWVRNGWKTSKKEPVKNRDLWMQLYELNQLLPVDWHWTKGHAGHTYNERCDALVQEAIRLRE
ncbi:ribonuclease HI [Spirochaeta africana]|uniref:Ribonuclease H n=1 Tax=Spirochaeta africana (strain ATCC 700263 / DSM 8902 / Z-7692) TaxID=889378 RepID=H9UGN9_SPIAZ|nr:ribonuclease HI [Spirochaeta africana]AFG36682.1 ribonuclease HI [Spirochaeta africana DSM 8902]